MKDKTIKKDTLRKLLTINEEFCKKQSKEIDSLERQLKLMIEERNKYKDKHTDFVSLRNELKKVTEANNKLIKAYAKKLGVVK